MIDLLAWGYPRIDVFRSDWEVIGGFLLSILVFGVGILAIAMLTSFLSEAGWIEKLFRVLGAGLIAAFLVWQGMPLLAGALLGGAW